MKKPRKSSKPSAGMSRKIPVFVSPASDQALQIHQQLGQQMDGAQTNPCPQTMGSYCNPSVQIMPAGPPATQQQIPFPYITLGPLFQEIGAQNGQDSTPLPRSREELSRNYEPLAIAYERGALYALADNVCDTQENCGPAPVITSLEYPDDPPAMARISAAVQNGSLAPFSLYTPANESYPTPTTTAGFLEPRGNRDHMGLDI
ncbi:hypothetical protein HY772_00560, partial [Candidatus Woesearchaeota archaeon]|nr:hypothetical protein [Candidatus Woesearchaeota archaeon]